MTVQINVVQNVEMPGPGAYLAVADGDDLHIWPQGRGHGPVITMSRYEWSRISREVVLAFARADKEKEL